MHKLAGFTQAVFKIKFLDSSTLPSRSPCPCPWACHGRSGAWLICSLPIQRRLWATTASELLCFGVWSNCDLYSYRNAKSTRLCSMHRLPHVVLTASTLRALLQKRNQRHCCSLGRRIWHDSMAEASTHEPSFPWAAAPVHMWWLLLAWARNFQADETSVCECIY